MKTELLTIPEACKEASRMGFKLSASIIMEMIKTDEIDFEVASSVEYWIPRNELERIKFLSENEVGRGGRTGSNTIRKTINANY